MADEWPVSHTPLELRQRWYDERMQAIADMEAEDQEIDGEPIEYTFLRKNLGRRPSFKILPSPPNEFDNLEFGKAQDFSNTPSSLDKQLSPILPGQLMRETTNTTQIHSLVGNKELEISEMRSTHILKHVQSTPDNNNEGFSVVRSSGERRCSEVHIETDNAVGVSSGKRHCMGTIAQIDVDRDMEAGTYNEANLRSAVNESVQPSQKSGSNRHNGINNGKDQTASEPCHKSRHFKVNSGAAPKVSENLSNEQRTRQSSKDRNCFKDKSNRLMLLTPISLPDQSFSSPKASRKRRFSETDLETCQDAEAFSRRRFSEGDIGLVSAPRLKRQFTPQKARGMKEQGSTQPILANVSNHGGEGQPSPKIARKRRHSEIDVDADRTKLELSSKRRLVSPTEHSSQGQTIHSTEPLHKRQNTSHELPENDLKQQAIPRSIPLETINPSEVATGSLIASKRTTKGMCLQLLLSGVDSIPKICRITTF